MLKSYIIILGDDQMKITKDINPAIFRAYDLRGLADVDLNDDVVYTLGKSYGSYVKQNGHYKVVIGHDNRLSSERIFKALTSGIRETGVAVIDLGLVTTPMYYYAKIYYNIPTGIMITASHNPKEDNGLKMSFSEIGNAYGELIQEFKKFTFQGEFITAKMGEIIKADIKNAYLDNLKKCLNFGPRKVKVVADCGNGTASIIIKEALDLFDLDYELLYCQSDGNFPNHPSDPAVSANMIELGAKVRELQADFGFGLDGDGDRVGVVDEKGRYITTDLLMLVIYRALADGMKNKKGLFDVKCSRSLIDGLEELGLKPVMNRTGNSYCNAQMIKGDFDFGGEYSGHLFFRDKYQGFDDGLYAALRVIEIFSNTQNSFSDLFKNIKKYYSTEETKIKVTENNKFDIVSGLKQYIIKKGYDYEDIDGLRVEFAKGWALIRASNTGPHLTVRFEADSEKYLAEIENEFMAEINRQIEINS